MQSNSILKIISREFSRIWNSAGNKFFYIALPVTLFIIFAAIYKNALVHELPIAVVDFNNSELSHTITRYYEASSAIKIVSYLNSIEEIKNEFRKGHIDGALYIPQGLDETLKSGRQAHVVLYINSSNIIKNNYLLNDGLKIIKTVSAGALLKKLRSSGLTASQAMGIINPIKVETQVLYNPNYSYSEYLVPALTTFGLAMIIMLVSCTLFNGEITSGTFSELVKISGSSAIRIITGKTLPHLLYYFINILLLICIILPLVNINFGSNLLPAVLFTFFFCCAIFFSGTAISLILNKEMMATEAALFLVMPSFLYSGLTFPLWGMPDIHNNIAQAIPYTHFLAGFIKIYMMKLPASELLPEILFLGIFGVCGFAMTYFLLRLKLKKVSSVE